MKNGFYGAVASTGAVCALLALSGGASRAQTLAQYTFDLNAGSTFAATTVGANATAGVINNTGSANSTFNANNAGNGLGYGTGFVLQAVVNTGASATSTNAATAVSTGSFFQFTVTPSAGYALTLTNLSFQAARGGMTAPRGYVVRSSVDNFSSDLGTADVTTYRPSSGGTGFSSYSVGLNYSGLTSATTFRIYDYAPITLGSVEYDNITLTGTSSVVASGAPEPSSFGLAASALPLAGLLVARRKRRA